MLTLSCHNPVFSRSWVSVTSWGFQIMYCKCC